ncbi:hypothetical protein ACJX0J_019445 [Zea mays]
MKCDNLFIYLFSIAPAVGMNGKLKAHNMETFQWGEAESKDTSLNTRILDDKYEVDKARLFIAIKPRREKAAVPLAYHVAHMYRFEDIITLISEQTTLWSYIYISDIMSTAAILASFIRVAELSDVSKQYLLGNYNAILLLETILTISLSLFLGEWIVNGFLFPSSFIT